MVAASGTRFDGLDLITLLAFFFLLATWAYLALLRDRQKLDDFELIKRREAAKAGLLTYEVHEVFGTWTSGETKYVWTPKVYDWRNDPIYFDWERDEPACQ